MNRQPRDSRRPIKKANVLLFGLPLEENDLICSLIDPNMMRLLQPKTPAEALILCEEWEIRLKALS